MGNHEVLLPRGQDPFITRLADNSYFYVTSGMEDTALLAARVRSISDLGSVALQPLEFEKPAEATKDMWAPEMHRIGGELFIYYAADGGDISKHRMHVLKARDPREPCGPWDYMGEMVTPDNQWAIDGTVMRTRHGNYFLWSGWPKDNPEGYDQRQEISIARMLSPLKLAAVRSCIASPEFPWERGVREVGGQVLTYEINEGPAMLQRRGRTWCALSASCSWTDDYCLALVEWNGKDPLARSSWRKRPEPWFMKADGLYGPGHCSFTTAGNDEFHMLYHTAVRSGGGWERQVRSTQVHFDDYDQPVIPKYAMPRVLAPVS